MLRTFCKSKMHRAVVTEANSHYAGSIAIDRHLLESADILTHKCVEVLSITTGNRVVPVPDHDPPVGVHLPTAR